MVRVISIRCTTPADFKLTKLFGIDDFSVAKDFGKVFIIIMYCFIIINCVVPENIHTLPMKDHWKYQGGGPKTKF